MNMLALSLGLIPVPVCAGPTVQVSAVPAAASQALSAETLQERCARVLAVLAGSDRGMTSKEIRLAVQISTTTAQQCVGWLQERGAIENRSEHRGAYCWRVAGRFMPMLRSSVSVPHELRDVLREADRLLQAQQTARSGNAGSDPSLSDGATGAGVHRARSIIKGRAVYLAGPMSGLSNSNYPAFFAAEQTLLECGAARVLNPARCGKRDSWAAYMRAGLAKLVKADVIVLLPGWEASRGACIERRVATELGIEILTLGGIA